MRKNVLRFACFQVVYQNFFIISARDDFFLEKNNEKIINDDYESLFTKQWGQMPFEHDFFL